ncbi:MULTISPECIES: ABC transporter substrate-binding protein [Frankia]|uniref:Branched-chain amino acid ABC transporter, amino acid-binding protein n=1 Tax=Frankia alni (strain DSM 45986 / CECT 9034 / ACN14a) TaxID=326424 RepID=Q0RJZ0_FRAAA|nr:MULTISPECIES: ABC transporter substrate-binding protein [Frankia]CAJ62170.1 putative branched-chain amino acid ABC transporter, amino acid-binding protein [Frankia alni ACN14a]
MHISSSRLPLRRACPTRSRGHLSRSGGRARAGLSAVALAVAVATGVAACGGSSGGGAGSTGGAAKSDSSLLGPAKAATGTPVKVGWVSTGRTQAVDTSGEIRAAQAVVDYANAHLGGLHGHKIELVPCEDKSIPASAQACGNQFLREKVSVVAAGSPGQTDPWLKIVAPAGIPVALNLVATQASLSTKDTFIWGNPLGSFGTPAAFARDKKLTSAAVFVIDVPAASEPAKQLIPPFFANAGTKAEVIAIPPGTADMTPQVQTAQKNKPAMYHVIGDPTFCASAIKAIKALGITAPITALDRCIGADHGASIPGGFSGVNIIAQANVDPSTPEFKLFDAVLKAYGKGLKFDAISMSGYQGMLGLVRGVNSVPGTDASPAAIATALHTMPPTTYPLGGGATFQCNGKANSVSPNICSTTGFIADSDKEGTLTNFRSLDTTGIFKLGAS